VPPTSWWGYGGAGRTAALEAVGHGLEMLAVDACEGSQVAGRRPWQQRQGALQQA